MKLKEELKKRGLVKDVSNEKLFDLYDKGGQSFYCGFDPSADSLHLGNFLGIMAAINIMKKGNKFFLLIGGATGMIGDPGGKESEREFLDEERLRHNEKSIGKQVEKLLVNLKKISGFNFECEVINNYDFYKNMKYLEFLREVGKYMTVNQMISKETVKKRIQDPSKSISYTEFSYMLLQGYDFYKLFTDKKCMMQIGGSDQWGNLVTGIELIRKKEDKEAFVFTFPLITDSNGKKFGKSEGNAIWISPEKNSPYFVYQYFMNTTDQDLDRFLKLLTLLDFDEISNIVKQHKKAPEKRFGQKTLGNYVVKAIFGEEAARQAEKISSVLFEGNKIDTIKQMNKAEIEALYRETGGTSFKNNTNILDLLVSLELCSSKGEAKKAIQSGAIFMNEEKNQDIGYNITKNDLIDSKVALIRKGKKTFKCIVN